MARRESTPCAAGLTRFVAALVSVVMVAPVAGAQGRGILLQIRPRLGDTIHMRLDQQVEMSGTTRGGTSDSTMAVTTAMLVLTHSIIGKSDAGGTMVTAVTDSVYVAATDDRATEAAEETKRMLQGKQVRLRIAPDGATDIVGGPESIPPELRVLFQQMPATLPRQAIRVGDSWKRTMVIPVDAQSDSAPGGQLRASFRLDSISPSGDSAFISVSGALTRAPGASSHFPPGVKFEMAGSLIGSMIVDRRRGWLTDSRTTIVVRSVVTPAPGGTIQPMHMKMKITQWLRAVSPARGSSARR